jgi:hypothetical protein
MTIFNSVLMRSIKFHLVPTLNGKMAVEPDFIGILKGHATSNRPQNCLNTWFA